VIICLLFLVSESTSLLGNGSVFPTIGARDSSEPMIYGVFTTPRWAVCDVLLVLNICCDFCCHILNKCVFWLWLLLFSFNYLLLIRTCQFCAGFCQYYCWIFCVNYRYAGTVCVELPSVLTRCRMLSPVLKVLTKSKRQFTLIGFLYEIQTFQVHILHRWVSVFQHRIECFLCLPDVH